MSPHQLFLVFELHQHDVPQKITFFIENSDSEEKSTVESHNSGQVGRPEIVPYCGIFPYFASSQNLRKIFFFVQRKLNIVVLFTN